MSSERRLYAELSDPERAIVEYALGRSVIHRDELLDELSETYGDEVAEQAFLDLTEEDRLFRKGNTPEYVMIRRDLF